MANLGNVIKILKADYDTIVAAYPNSATISTGATVTYDPNSLYLVEGDSSVVTDVQINNVSIVSDGVANIPYATNLHPGVMWVSGGAGISASHGSGYCTIKLNPQSGTQALTSGLYLVIPTGASGTIGSTTFYHLAYIYNGTLYYHSSASTASWSTLNVASAVLYSNCRTLKIV